MPVPPAEPGEILIDGEAIVEVLGQVEAAILVREADGPVTPFVRTTPLTIRRPILYIVDADRGA